MSQLRAFAARRSLACVRSRCLGNGLVAGDIANLEVSLDDPGAAIFELYLRLDVLRALSGIQRIDEHRIFFCDETAPHLARARELVVVGIELLVQDKKALHLRV